MDPEEERIEAQGALDDESISVSRATLTASLEIMDDHVDASGPCDHDVNLCVCGMKMVADELRRAMALAPRYSPRVAVEELEGAA